MVRVASQIESKVEELQEKPAWRIKVNLRRCGDEPACVLLCAVCNAIYGVVVRLLYTLASYGLSSTVGPCPCFPSTPS